MITIYANGSAWKMTYAEAQVKLGNERLCNKIREEIRMALHKAGKATLAGISVGKKLVAEK